MQTPAREKGAKPARNVAENGSAQEKGVIYGAGRRNVAACAGKGCQIRPERCGEQFCAGKGYHFGR